MADGIAQNKSQAQGPKRKVPAVEGCVPSCAVFAMVDRLPVEEGWVYGQKPKEPEARGIPKKARPLNLN